MVLNHLVHLDMEKIETLNDLIAQYEALEAKQEDGTITMKEEAQLVKLSDKIDSILFNS